MDGEPVAYVLKFSTNEHFLGHEKTQKFHNSNYMLKFLMELEGSLAFFFLTRASAIFDMYPQKGLSFLL